MVTIRQVPFVIWLSLVVTTTAAFQPRWVLSEWLPPRFTRLQTQLLNHRLPSSTDSDPNWDRPTRIPKAFPDDTKSKSSIQPLSSSSSFHLIKKKPQYHLDREKLEWMQRATDRIVLHHVPGTLISGGKWHEVVSLLQAWSSFQKQQCGDSPAVRMESLLTVLVQEQQQQQAASGDCSINRTTTRSSNSTTTIVITMDLYNCILDAWACAALFGSMEHPELASQRAREILVALQENYERRQQEQNDGLEEISGTNNNDKESTTPQQQQQLSALKPNAKSFNLVLHAARKAEGVVVARRVLAWMEYLYKSGRNVNAKPGRSDYVQLLDAYGKQHHQREKSSHILHKRYAASVATTPAGVLTEAFLRHVQCQPQAMVEPHRLPDTVCYNIVIRAWTRQRRGRESAEHADRLLEEMKAERCERCQPNEITYGSVISAWAASGMKSHAVHRVEELLREIEDSDSLEFNTVILNAVMSTWVKSKNPVAVGRTEEILRKMEMLPNAKPDLVSYNTHLHALSLHSSTNQRDLANRAETLLLTMERGFESGAIPFGPNLFTYNLAIEAVCKVNDSSSSMRASILLRKLIQNESVEPDTFSFNQVLVALSKGTKKESASTAESLLRYMDESYKTGVHIHAKPNAASYAAVLAACGICGDRQSAESGEHLLLEMKRRAENGELNLKPTRACYNSLIDCWARSGEGTFGARKAEALLQEMQTRFEAGDADVSPNIMTFNAVLNAWAKSGTRCCGYQAEKYLDQMWQRYNAGNNKVKPNDFSYNTVINAISKSKNGGKGQKALRILRRMDKLYQADNSEARPNEITYTAVINSCAFPSVRDSRTRRKALDTAMFTLKELQGSGYGQPNQVTYGTFIRACVNLLHDDSEMRRVVMKQVFRQCCKDGQVGQMVLNYTPRELQKELLSKYMRSDGKVLLDDLPLEWRCNTDDRTTWRDKRQLYQRNPGYNGK